MRRRDFIGAAGGAVIGWPLAARAQRKVAKIGILLVGNREPFGREFYAGLRDLGYVEGQNIQFEYRSAEGKLPALGDLAAELVGLNVDAIVASETPAVFAAKRATSVIPIVMAPAGDPLGTGLVASLARPGGNVTGLSAATAELAGKSIELIREILPQSRRVAALADPTNPFSKSFLEQIHLAARSAQIEIHVVNVKSTDTFDEAFADMEKNQAQALIVQPTLPRKQAIDL
jgi:putative ABC transport system substrate-binding protein